MQTFSSSWIFQVNQLQTYTNFVQTIYKLDKHLLDHRSTPPWWREAGESGTKQLDKRANYVSRDQPSAHELTYHTGQPSPAPGVRSASASGNPPAWSTEEEWNIQTCIMTRRWWHQNMQMCNKLKPNHNRTCVNSLQTLWSVCSGLHGLFYVNLE